MTAVNKGALNETNRNMSRLAHVQQSILLVFEYIIKTAKSSLHKIYYELTRLILIVYPL